MEANCIPAASHRAFGGHGNYYTRNEVKAVLTYYWQESRAEDEKEQKGLEDEKNRKNLILNLSSVAGARLAGALYGKQEPEPKVSKDKVSRAVASPSFELRSSVCLSIMLRRRCRCCWSG